MKLEKLTGLRLSAFFGLDRFHSYVLHLQHMPHCSPALSFILLTSYGAHLLEN